MCKRRTPGRREYRNTLPALTLQKLVFSSQAGSYITARSPTVPEFLPFLPPCHYHWPRLKSEGLIAATCATTPSSHPPHFGLFTHSGKIVSHFFWQTLLHKKRYCEFEEFCVVNGIRCQSSYILEPTGYAKKELPTEF